MIIGGKCDSHELDWVIKYLLVSVLHTTLVFSLSVDEDCSRTCSLLLFLLKTAINLQFDYSGLFYCVWVDLLLLPHHKQAFYSS